MNVTLSLDDEVIAKARKQAEVLGTSVNQLIREYLVQFVGNADRAADMLEFEDSHIRPTVTAVDGNLTAKTYMNVDGGLAFFDTNILIYTDDPAEPAKQKLATSLVAAHGRADTIVISVQVLQEYFAAATKKLKIDPAVVQRKVELLARGKVVRFTERDVIAAIELHRVAQISFWDAMIVHAARSVNATVLYTEDLAHGTSIAGVPIRNPFTPDHGPIITENKTT